MDPYDSDGSSAPIQELDLELLGRIAAADGDDFAFSWVGEKEGIEEPEVEVGEVPKNTRVNYSQDELVQHYIRVSVACGHPARGYELAAWAKEHGGPGAHIYFRDLGSLHKVRALASMQDGAFLERKELIACYAALSAELGHPAKTREIEAASRKGKSPTYHRYMQTFSTLEELRVAANVVEHDKNYDLICHYRALAHELGRTPDSAMMNKAHKRKNNPLATRKHYENTFGGLTEFQRSLGMPPSYRKLRWPWTPVLLFQYLEDLEYVLGRLPEAFDVIEASRKPRFRDGKRIATPKLQFFQYWFGSYEEALWQGFFMDKPGNELRMWDRFAAELRAACSPGLQSITPRQINGAAKRGVIASPWLLKQWFGGVGGACVYADVRLVDEL